MKQIKQSYMALILINVLLFLGNIQAMAQSFLATGKVLDGNNEPLVGAKIGRASCRERVCLYV